MPLLQPNYGSVAASCSIEVSLNDTDLTDTNLVVARIRQAYDTCRQSAAAELVSHDHHDHANEPDTSNGKGKRSAATGDGFS